MTAIAIASTSFGRTRGRFGADRRGTVAVLTGLLIVPMMVSAGVAVDLSRATAVHAALQNAADSAALAGAGVYTSAQAAAVATSEATTYIRQATATLPTADNAQFTVSTGTVTDSTGQVSGYTVTVTATAAIPTTLMSLVTPSVATSASSTAENKLLAIMPNNAAVAPNNPDADTVYWYVVHQDGSLPDDSELHRMFSNTDGESPDKLAPIRFAAGQTIGFALANRTGGNMPYGHNQYGGEQGQTHMFYSQLSVPNANAYPSENHNCSLQVTATQGSTGSQGQGNQGQGNQGQGNQGWGNQGQGNQGQGNQGREDSSDGEDHSHLTPVSGTMDCMHSPGESLTFAWDDMGGHSDDQKFDSASFTVSCPAAPTSGASGGSSGGSSGSLTDALLLIR